MLYLERVQRLVQAVVDLNIVVVVVGVDMVDMVNIVVVVVVAVGDIVVVVDMVDMLEMLVYLDMPLLMLAWPMVRGERREETPRSTEPPISERDLDMT